MVREKTISITKTWLRKMGCSKEEVEKYAGKIKVKRWTFGAKKRAQSESIKFDVTGTKPDFNTFEFSINKILGCIVEAPFPITREEIENLPDFLGDRVEQTVNEIVGITEDQIRNLKFGLNEES